MLEEITRRVGTDSEKHAVRDRELAAISANDVPGNSQTAEQQRYGQQVEVEELSDRRNTNRPRPHTTASQIGSSFRTVHTRRQQTSYPEPDLL